MAKPQQQYKHQSQTTVIINNDIRHACKKCTKQWLGWLFRFYRLERLLCSGDCAEVVSANSESLSCLPIARKRCNTTCQWKIMKVESTIRCFWLTCERQTTNGVFEDFWSSCYRFVCVLQPKPCTAQCWVLSIHWGSAFSYLAPFGSDCSPTVLRFCVFNGLNCTVGCSLRAY